jgi:hypothetical protein
LRRSEEGGGRPGRGRKAKKAKKARKARKAKKGRKGRKGSSLNWELWPRNSGRNEIPSALMMAAWSSYPGSITKT